MRRFIEFIFQTNYTWIWWQAKHDYWVWVNSTANHRNNTLTTRLFWWIWNHRVTIYELCFAFRKYRSYFLRCCWSGGCVSFVSIRRYLSLIDSNKSWWTQRYVCAYKLPKDYHMYSQLFYVFANKTNNHSWLRRLCNWFWLMPLIISIRYDWRATINRSAFQRNSIDRNQMIEICFNRFHICCPLAIAIDIYFDVLIYIFDRQLAPAR